MRAHSFARKALRQRGAGLIEVMVAILVLAIGLLGIAGMQLVSLQNNHCSTSPPPACTSTTSPS